MTITILCFTKLPFELRPYTYKVDVYELDIT